MLQFHPMAMAGYPNRILGGLTASFSLVSNIQHVLDLSSFDKITGNQAQNFNHFKTIYMNHKNILLCNIQTCLDSLLIMS